MTTHKYSCETPRASLFNFNDIGHTSLWVSKMGSLIAYNQLLNKSFKILIHRFEMFRVEHHLWMRLEAQGIGFRIEHHFYIFLRELSLPCSTIPESTNTSFISRGKNYSIVRGLHHLMMCTGDKNHLSCLITHQVMGASMIGAVLVHRASRHYIQKLCTPTNTHHRDAEP